MIGGIFAALLYYAITGQVIAIQIGDTDDQRIFALSVLGFLAGFNERWATDMILVAQSHFTPSHRTTSRPDTAKQLELQRPTVSDDE
jgi:hypothetical protein